MAAAIKGSSAISDLINCVASSCLPRHLPSALPLHAALNDDDDDEEDEYVYSSSSFPRRPASAVIAVPGALEDDEDRRLRIWEEEKANPPPPPPAVPKAMPVPSLDRAAEMETLMAEVFEGISAVRRAYAGLQEAHSPWDPDRMRAADAAVVAELRKLGRLRDRFRRGCTGGGGGGGGGGGACLREAVAPYEAAMDELRRELKAKTAEVEALKGKLSGAVAVAAAAEELACGRRRGKINPTKRVGCVTAAALGAVTVVAASPTTELFVACMEQVRLTARSFTVHLLHLMRAARCDVTAAVQSMVAAAPAEQHCKGGTAADLRGSSAAPHHVRHALEAYVNRQLFQGFEHETFYLDGSLSSLLNPGDFRRQCFTQFCDMRGMDPAELLGILPGCQFGQFALAKYLAIVKEPVEQALFCSTEQRRQVAAGAHPRTAFYGEFLQAAKSVWMLHLLAFAMEPLPGHFEASKGAEFHPGYMESVVKFPGGRIPHDAVVGFPVAPGFRLAGGTVIRARVFLVPRAAGAGVLGGGVGQ